MTMGQPNKRSKTTTTTAKRAPTKAAPATAPTSTSRRGQASTELRKAVEGREHEFAGIGFIAVGVLLGLAIYLNLAGPLGRGVETVVGWLTGLGRFVVPIALVAIGAALVGKGQSMRRFRLAIGWGLLGLSILGLLHVVRGPEKIMANAPAASKIVHEVIGSKPYDYWVEKFRTLEGQWAPVQDSVELAHDPQVRANGWISEITDADGVTRELVTNPVQFDETPVQLTRGPQFAEHTDEILREIGIDDDQAIALKISGAVT